MNRSLPIAQAVLQVILSPGSPSTPCTARLARGIATDPNGGFQLCSVLFWPRSADLILPQVSTRQLWLVSPGWCSYLYSTSLRLFWAFSKASVLWETQRTYKQSYRHFPPAGTQFSHRCLQLCCDQSRYTSATHSNKVSLIPLQRAFSHWLKLTLSSEITELHVLLFASHSTPALILPNKVLEMTGTQTKH